jgi:hypothetical protein
MGRFFGLSSGLTQRFILWRKSQLVYNLKVRQEFIASALMTSVRCFKVASSPHTWAGGRHGICMETVRGSSQ